LEKKAKKFTLFSFKCAAAAIRLPILSVKMTFLLLLFTFFFRFVFSVFCAASIRALLLLSSFTRLALQVEKVRKIGKKKNSKK